MPLIIHTSKSDLMKGQIITPGWKECSVENAYAKQSKDGASVNYWITLAFVGDPDGRTLEHNFNSKALGISLQNFLAACAGKTVVEFMASLPKDVDFDLEQAIGKKLMVKTKNEIYEGRPTNKIEDFASLGKAPF